MNNGYIKPQLKSALGVVLRDELQATNDPEVDRYAYATKLGTLDHIDYAVPLFGYAQQIKKSPLEIYELLSKSLHDIDCTTEFVNGYLNIMLSNTYLQQALQHRIDATVVPAEGLHPVAVATAMTTESALALQLLHGCLDLAGINLRIVKPLQTNKSIGGRYFFDDDTDIRQELKTLTGVKIDSGQALYFEHDSDAHALCSVKGGWYPRALNIAAVHKNSRDGSLVCLVGTSAENQLVRSVFPSAHSLDVDIQAKQIDDSHDRPIKPLVISARQEYAARTVSSLHSKDRKELLYLLDFEYEVAEAVRLGDLKRLVGEVTTLFEQHPVTHVS